jgi:hypothetical protein
MELKVEHKSKRKTDLSPRHMAVMKLPPEVREAMEDMALTIFTDMVNSGASLQQTLTAIYLSGIQHTVHSIKEGQDDQR